jgi:hypothetical protein
MGEMQQPSGWDADLTDGRKKGEWRSAYPPEARKCIRKEMGYLTTVFILCILGIFSILYKIYTTPHSTDSQQPQGIPLDTQNNFMLFWAYLGAWVAGTLGGCSYGIKWMYHIVAKGLWHEDRRLWRIFSPHLSGVVALIMTFLITSGILQLFDKTFSERPIGVLAFSFLVGYFSDKALAKMAEVADTLFGGQITKNNS